MDKLDLIQKNGVMYTDSRQVAKMIGKLHKNLVRDIEEYQSYMEDTQSSNLSFEDFFQSSSYIAGTGKAYKCYLITKKGCELIAHKLTGKRGVQFSATYITQFHEMESRRFGGMEVALLEGLEEIKELKAQMTRQQKLLSGKAASGINERNFWGIREYAELIGYNLTQAVNILGMRAANYSREHGVVTFLKRSKGSKFTAYHIDVLKWLFGQLKGGEV